MPTQKSSWLPTPALIKNLGCLIKLLFGLTTPARGDWDNTPWENKAITVDPYDPEQAKTILDGLGWAPGPDGIRQKGGQRLAFDHTTTSGSQLRENVQLLSRILRTSAWK